MESGISLVKEVEDITAPFAAIVAFIVIRFVVMEPCKAAKPVFN
jgi:hypothetical protein